MIKSIKFKLWLTFIIMLVVSMTSMLVLTHASVKKGFLDYATEQTIDRLDNLVDQVVEFYAQNGSFEKLKGNTGHWTRLKRLTIRRYIESSKDSIAQEPPPSIKAHQKEFIDHLILTDANKNLLVGNWAENEEYSWQALNSGSKDIIGYIGYIKPKDFLRSVDQLFVYQQLRAFAVISIALIFTSFFVAMVVSRWLVEPLSALSRSAQNLASGNYDVRIEPKSADELGQLCNNFNELAITLSANEVARKQWVADISHEMRTPLSVLKAQVEAMLDGIRPASTQNLELLQTKIDSLSLLINDLYELSLSDLGALSYNKSHIDIAAMLMQLESDYKDRCAQSGIDFSYASDAKQCMMFADKQRLLQLFNNLVENCIRYTDAPGKVVLHLKENSKNIAIIVEDSAPGVPYDKYDAIFDRLFRLEGSRNRSTGGAGLGLSICKNIIEAHGGEITAAPSELGGLTVNICLPKDES